MSQPVDDRMRELKDDVREMEVLPAAEVRARGRERRRRQLAAVTAAGAVVAVTAGVVFLRPDQRPAPPAELPVAAADARISCDLTLPGDPREIQVRVLGGGAPGGKSEAVAAELRKRDFSVRAGTIGDSPWEATGLRYGPAAIGAATVLRATVHGEAVMSFDPGRRDKTIDLNLGLDFDRLATATELNQNLVAAGQPSAPPECASR